MVTAADLVALDHERCWELVRARTLGRLAFTDMALPSIRPLSYAVDGAHLVLRVSPGLAERLDGQVVAFEVDDVDEAARVGASVVLTGTVRRVTSGSEAARTTGLTPSWVAQRDAVTLRLTVGRLDGRRLVRHDASP